MMEEITRAVREIFADWEETPELSDLKEEIAVNLHERILDMQSGGMSRAEALRRALDELGDVTEAADEISRRRRVEVIAGAYMRRIPMDRLHAVGYPLAGLALAMGLLLAVMQLLMSGSILRTLGALMPFAVVSAGAFVFLGLSQETRTNHPMGKKRAAVYGAVVMLLLFGAFVSGITVFGGATLAEIREQGLVALKLQLLAAEPGMALGSLIPFVLPGLAVLAFLILTEKDRTKQWVRKMEERELERYGERFGLLSGALWMLAIALFVLLGILVSWRISWTVFLFATAGECLLLFLHTPKKDGGRGSR